MRGWRSDSGSDCRTKALADALGAPLADEDACCWQMGIAAAAVIFIRQAGVRVDDVEALSCRLSLQMLRSTHRRNRRGLEATLPQTGMHTESSYRRIDFRVSPFWIIARAEPLATALWRRLSSPHESLPILAEHEAV